MIKPPGSGQGVPAFQCLQGAGRRIPGGKSLFDASQRGTQLQLSSPKSRRTVHNRDGTN
jgi:hypothetical protein